jgi:hypothetical protein
LFVNGRICSTYVEFHCRATSTTLELERLFATFAALVRERDDEARVEERELAKTRREHVVLDLGDREDLVVRLERDLRAGAIRVADHAERRDGRAAPVLLEVHVAFAADFELEPLAHRVDRADADTVETRGDLVAAVVELAAGVEDRHDDLGGADLAAELLRLFGVNARRDAATVVLHGDGSVEVDRHVELGAEPREVLVYAVVDDLPNEVVQARAVVHIADVHARPFANCLEPLEDRDAFAVVTARGRRDGLRGRRRIDVRHVEKFRMSTRGIRFETEQVLGLSVRAPEGEEKYSPRTRCAQGKAGNILAWFRALMSCGQERISATLQGVEKPCVSAVRQRVRRPATMRKSSRPSSSKGMSSGRVVVRKT